MPENTVLGFQHPVVLVWEDEQLSRNAAQTGSIEGAHALIVNNAVVLFAVDAEDGRIPLIYKLMGRILVSLVGTCGTILGPIGIGLLPV